MRRGQALGGSSVSRFELFRAPINSGDCHVSIFLVKNSGSQLRRSGMLEVCCRVLTRSFEINREERRERSVFNLRNSVLSRASPTLLDHAYQKGAVSRIGKLRVG
jgi:hypothetical protein